MAEGTTDTQRARAMYPMVEVTCLAKQTNFMPTGVEFCRDVAESYDEAT